VHFPELGEPTPLAPVHHQHLVGIPRVLCRLDEPQIAWTAVVHVAVSVIDVQTQSSVERAE
jgi:hypothetical protein